jgi:hypothetical protein
MEQPRSSRKVGDILDKYKSQIDSWCSSNHWVKRCHLWDNELDRRSTNTQVAEIKSMKRRQARMAFEMQSAAKLALEALTARLLEEKKKAENSGAATKSIISSDNLVRLADTGARLERLNFDEPENITRVEESDYSNLSTEELLQLRKLLLKTQGKDLDAA